MKLAIHVLSPVFFPHIRSVSLCQRKSTGLDRVLWFNFIWLLLCVVLNVCCWSRWHLGNKPRFLPKLCQCKNINAHDPCYLLPLHAGKRKRSQWLEFFCCCFGLSFFEFISKGCLQLVSFIFLSESTIADGISESSWQELYLVSKLKIILEGIL